MKHVRPKGRRKITPPRKARRSTQTKKHRRAPSRAGAALARLTRQLEQAAGGVRLAIDRIEDEFHGLLEAARLEERRALVRSLAEGHILDYLLALDDALRNSPAGALPDSVVAVQDGPRFFVKWLREALHVEPWQTIGTVLLLDDADMERFELEGSGAVSFPIQVQVRSSGWCLQGTPIAKPRVARAEVPGSGYRQEYRN